MVLAGGIDRAALARERAVDGPLASVPVIAVGAVDGLCAPVTPSTGEDYKRDASETVGFKERSGCGPADPHSSNPRHERSGNAPMWAIE